MIQTKYLRPKESTIESSEDFATQFDRPDDDIIMVEFPDKMLTPEVRTHITT